MSRGRILLSGVLVVLLLGVLSAGLHDMEFRSGRFGALPEPPEPGLGALPLPYRWAEVLLEVWVWIFVGGALIGFVVSMFDRRLRKRVLLGLFGALLCAFAFMVVMESLVGEMPDELLLPDEEAAGAWGPVMTPEASEPVPERPDAPGWLLYVAAVAGATLLLVGGWWVVGKVRARIRRTDAETELRQTVAQAAEELREGLPVDEVVIRCWARMAELLAPRLGPAGAPTVTPREMAAALRGHGVHDQAVEELTALFEEVRYGHKEALTRRDRALSALSAVEGAYGVG